MDTSIVNASRKRNRDEELVELEETFVVVCVIIRLLSFMAWYHDTYLAKEPARNWELERRDFLNRLYRGKESDCIDQLRVSKRAFSKLCKILQDKGGLVRSRNVPTTEAVAMFLHILAHNLKYRVVEFSYCRSKETISRQFNNVLRAIMKVSKEYLNFHDYNLEDSEAYKWKWFENSVGALDGTHIPITVAADDRPRYRNRKGDITTNVLGVCGPDLRYIYVLPGWEGSAGDSRVLRDALRRQNCLRVPNGKYFLVDAGYTNGPGFLAPYRGTRYHLNEWIGNTPQNYKELFNLRHATARNVIERSFGVMKKRWSILRTPSFFDIKTQIRIINACFILQNFIIDEKKSDPILEVQDLQLLSATDGELANQQTERLTTGVADVVTSVQVSDEWTQFRETLAMNMFVDYQARRNIT